MRARILSLTVCIAAIVLGCGNPVDAPVQLPDKSPAVPATFQPGESNRFIWGLWNISISPDAGTVDIVPDRTGVMHLNAVNLLEVSPCTTCLTISDLVLYPPNELAVDLNLQHPYPGKDKLTCFDVRGILITGADYLFPVSGRSFAWGSSMMELVNADGYTALFNPTEFPEGGPVPWVLKYTPGKFAPGGELTARLNPYVAYADTAPRRIFYAGGQTSRTVRIRYPAGPMEFGYAVDASWVPVDGPVTDPLIDFPPEANCLEAYQIDFDLQSELQSTPGATAPIEIVVYDHQGLATISAVSIESPQLFDGEADVPYFGTISEGIHVYRGQITNEPGAVVGDYPVLVKAIDANQDPNLGEVHGWNVSTVSVTPGAGEGGWARTWPGYMEGMCAASETEIDSGGNIYVTGYFNGDFDFDPGPGEDLHTGNGHFISKFNAAGEHLWAVTWESDSGTFASGLAVSAAGSVYVTGEFVEETDFDPGPGVDIRTPTQGGDIYLSQFTTSGAYHWVRTWGASPGPWASEQSFGLAADSSDCVYMTGHFGETIDFDPGPGIQNLASNGGLDMFLVKLDTDGQFQWAHTWGSDHAEGVAEMDWARDVDVDESDFVYVTGTFNHTVDFDPGPGVDNHTSNLDGDYPCDMFLSKFDSDGVYQWGRSWGGSGAQDNCYGVSADYPDSVYVCGTYDGVADFDPGSGVDQHTSFAWEDGFLSRFSPAGDFLWARTWGGIDSGVVPKDVTADSSGSVCTTGWFHGTVDFDPGAGVDQHSSLGDSFQFIYMSRLTAGGDFAWALTWGGGADSLTNRGHGCDADSAGNIYVGGEFEGTIDFDPGAGVDNHTGEFTAFLLKVLPNGLW